jgi:hypothetical protein
MNRTVVIQYGVEEARRQAVTKHERMVVEAAYQVFPVTAVISSAHRAQGIFWRISAESPPIRSCYVCLCVPGGAFR